MNGLRWVVNFLGRVLLSLIFITSGINKILDWNGAEMALSQALSDTLSYSFGYEWLKEMLEKASEYSGLLLVVATAAEIIGGLCIFLGIAPRFGAFVLFLFMIPTTFLFHHFWWLHDSARELQMISFFKNLSITGGILILASYPRARACPVRLTLPEDDE